ncbi:MAG: DUF3311 domain-containing protein [Verrucomicrobiia bacterium]|jgi:hypothetical protein|tara:strand:- start:124 stop:342 length:219 start_codon:yes stop_codon:yes gene_type:complete
MKSLAIAFMFVLFVLHQDFWLKDNGTLVMGFLPASLAYHMAFTFLAAIGWCFMVRFAWPHFPEDDEEEGVGS